MVAEVEGIGIFLLIVVTLAQLVAPLKFIKSVCDVANDRWRE